MTNYTYKNPPRETLQEDDRITFSPDGSQGYVHSTYICLDGPYPFKGYEDKWRVNFARKLFGYSHSITYYQQCPEYVWRDFRAATRLVWGILSLSKPEKYPKLEALIKPPKVDKFLTLLKTAPWITNERDRRAMIPIISRYAGVNLAPLMKEKA